MAPGMEERDVRNWWAKDSAGSSQAADGALGVLKIKNSSSYLLSRVKQGKLPVSARVV